MSQPPPAPVDPKIGMVLQERYRIVRKIGDGGMGAVYEGEHVVIKRRVAIKVLHPQFAQNKEITARFHREAEAATSIGHPHIVEVTDMGAFPDGSAYMVLEFLEGRDWSDDIQKEGPQPLGKVAKILSQVCDALEAAHAKGIVHRDLKPENIFLIDRHGDPDYVKVVDFGISKIIDTQEADRSLTQTGTALGTPYYMAPEQCQGKKDVDHRADIYSLGVILFQALTAQYPFDDESYPMLVLKICTEPAPQLAAFRSDLPPQVQEVLHHMLAKDRNHRFNSCSEVKAALAPFLGNTQAPVLAANAPRTAHAGPSVLAGGNASGPAHTPSGTQYLPNNLPQSVPQPTPYPLEAQPPSNKGLILGVVAMLGFIVLVGGGLGTYFAIAGADHSGEAHAQTDPPPTANPPADETPAAVEETPDEPAAQPTEAAPAEPAAVQQEDEGEPTINVTVEAPVGAQLWIDGELEANPYIGPLTPGEHRIRATASGYRDFEESVPLRRDGQRYEVRMARQRPVHVAQQPVQPPPVWRPAPPPPSPPPRDPHQTVGAGAVFR